MSRVYVDHMGIIVEDLERSLALFERLFGLKPTTIKEMDELGLRVAHLNAENVGIELIQYTGEGENFGKKVMGPKPGMNHFSVKVEDVAQTVGRFQDEGLQVMDGFPREGSHGQVAFFEPESTEQILLEVCG